MDERRFARLDSMAAITALTAMEITFRDPYLPDFGSLFGYRDEPQDWSPYRRQRRKAADPVKKAARKRQRQARAKSRRKK